MSIKNFLGRGLVLDRLRLAWVALADGTLGAFGYANLVDSGPTCLAPYW